MSLDEEGLRILVQR